MSENQKTKDWAGVLVVVLIYVGAFAVGIFLFGKTTGAAIFGGFVGFIGMAAFTKLTKNE
jgi:hypothetical protein